MQSVHINGAIGEAGGQVLRTALTLSMVSGKRLQMTKIRAGRKKPGLMRQHLTCVRAAAKICSAEVDGDDLNSQELTFQPGLVQPGDYDFRIGSAGSTSLVLQTVFPALASCSTASTVRLEGGTHNPKAPCADFLMHVFAPQAARWGLCLDLELHRHGFVPAGGGVLFARIKPTQVFSGVELLSRIGQPRYRGRVLLSQLDRSIAHREIKTLTRRIGIAEEDCSVEMVESSGPGNAVLVSVEYENCGELICESGRIGVKAERVARAATGEMRKYIACGAPVGKHLADQLMLPAALAASQGHSSRLLLQDWSSHCATHQRVLESFLSVSFERVETAAGIELSITPARS